MDIFSILNLIGGLSLFLFGMSLMGQALERRAGNRLKVLLGKLTTNRIWFCDGTWCYCCDTEFISNHSHGRWFCQFWTYDIAPGYQCYYGG